MAVQIAITVPAVLKKSLADAIALAVAGKGKAKEVIFEEGGTHKKPHTVAFRVRSKKDFTLAMLRVRYAVKKAIHASEGTIEPFVPKIEQTVLVYRGENANATASTEAAA